MLKSRRTYIYIYTSFSAVFSLTQFLSEEKKNELIWLSDQALNSIKISKSENVNNFKVLFTGNNHSFQFHTSFTMMLITPNLLIRSLSNAFPAYYGIIPTLFLS